MNSQPTCPNNEFIVQESIGSNLIIFIVFLIITLLVFINIGDQPAINYLYLLIPLLPAIGCFVKIINRKNVIRINSSGFYHYDVLKTNWDNFQSAESREEQRDDNLQFQFVFVIRFYQPGEGTYELKIIMRNTFNRSGEEVIKAINYFRNPPLK